MAINLPAIPKEADVQPRLVRAGGDLGGQQGGAVQRVLRLGSRYALDVTLPKMEATTAAVWISAAIGSDTLGDTLVAVFPQAALGVSLGTPVVDGAGQQGATLAVRGLSPGVTIPAARFFSFVANGRNYLYATRQAATADGTGRATLAIGPKIRKAPSDGAALDFVTAKIEGFLDGQEQAWTVERLSWIGASFSLRENK